MQNCLYGVLEGIAVDFIQRHADFVDVRGQHGTQNILIAHSVAGHFHALHGRQFVSNHLLQRLLQLRIPCIAQLRGKTHHRGFADADRRAELACGQKCRFIIVFNDILRNQTLSLGKRGQIVLYFVHQIIHSFCLLYTYGFHNFCNFIVSVDEQKCKCFSCKLQNLCRNAIIPLFFPSRLHGAVPAFPLLSAPANAPDAENSPIAAAPWQCGISAAP